MAAVTRIIAILLALDLVTDIYARSAHSKDVLDGIHPTKDDILDSDPHQVQKKPSPEKRNRTKSQTRPSRKKWESKPSPNQPQTSVIKQETGLQTRKTANISPLLTKGKFQQDKSPVMEIFNEFDSSANKSKKIKPSNKLKDDSNNSGNKDMKRTKLKENKGGKSDNAWITPLVDDSQKKEDDDFSGEDSESEENDDENPPEQHDYDDEEIDVAEEDYKPKKKPEIHNRHKSKLRGEKGAKHSQRYKLRDDDEDLSEEEEEIAPFYQEMLTKLPRGKKRNHWLDRLEDDNILPPSVQKHIAELEKYGSKYLDDLYRQKSAPQRRKFGDREQETKPFKILKDRPSQQNQDARDSFRPKIKYEDDFHPYPSRTRLRNKENARQFRIPNGRDQLVPYNKNSFQKGMLGTDEQHEETYGNSYLDPKNIKQDNSGNLYVGFPESELRRVLSNGLPSFPSTKPQWPRGKAVSYGNDNNFPQTKDISYLPNDYDKMDPLRPPGSRAFRVQETPPSPLKLDPQGGMFNMFGDTRAVQNEHYAYYPPRNPNVPLNRPNVREWPPKVEEPFPVPSRNNVIRPGKQNYAPISQSPLDDWTVSVLEKILGPANTQNLRRGMASTVWEPTTSRRLVRRSIGPEDDIKDPELPESRIKRSQSQYRSLGINRSTSKEDVNPEQWRPLPNSVSSYAGNPYVYKTSGGTLTNGGEKENAQVIYGASGQIGLQNQPVGQEPTNKRILQTSTAFKPQ